ncbi:MAG: arylesterase [Betaproteobacteria bacterium]|nr:arylesterase [Betaproteobacteria bacterium]
MICSVSAFNAILRLWVVFTLALPAGAASAATILVYGDSLSSGYGLPREQGWASLLARRLQSEKFNYKIANASISGETTLGGANRIESALGTHRPAVVVLALGANDGLRGADLDAMRANLEAMADACRRAGARVLLVGMRLPPNYGTPYADKFQRVFGEVARNRKLRWVPFLLEGFGEQREYFQADGIHPTAAAQPLMLDTVWKGLRPLLKR